MRTGSVSRCLSSVSPSIRLSHSYSIRSSASDGINRVINPSRNGSLNFISINSSNSFGDVGVKRVAQTTERNNGSTAVELARLKVQSQHKASLNPILFVHMLPELRSRV